MIFVFENAYAQESDVLSIAPTDDAFVLVDLVDSDDLQEFRQFNSGNLDHLKIGYALNTTQIPNAVLSVSFLKFDLDAMSKQTDSAKLRLYVDYVKLSTPQEIGVYLVTNSTWGESTITYDNMPSFSDLVGTVIVDSPNWYEWELQNLPQQNIGDSLSLMISFVNFLPNTEDVIVFASKDLQNTEFAPSLIFTDTTQKSSTGEIESLDDSVKETQNIYSVKIIPVLEDAYVGANYANLQGFEEMRNINTGNFNFTKIWYAYNSTGTGELLVSSGYLKFDLSELNTTNIIDAQLKMYNTLMTTSDAEKIISVYSTDNSTWSETTLTFDNKPEIVKQIDLVQIDDVGNWISWNVTDAIGNNTNDELTLSLIYEVLLPGHEEQTVFNSKEAQENTPYLEIVYDVSNEGGGCLIATATYGSELAPQVQQLRELRDNHLLQTESGSAFMTLFNQFYYSFSPYIADYERENPIFKELIRLSITPLVSSLSLLNFVDLNSESSVLGYGVSIITLNIGMYFVSPVLGVKIIRMLFFTKKEGRFL